MTDSSKDSSKPTAIQDELRQYLSSLCATVKKNLRPVTIDELADAHPSREKQEQQYMELRNRWLCQHIDPLGLKPYVPGPKFEYIGHPLDVLQKGESEGIIRRYTAVFEQKFTQWMSIALAGAVNKKDFNNEVVTALADNLYCEYEQNHPQMLRNFAKYAGAAPTLGDKKMADRFCASIEGLMLPSRPVFAIGVVTALETTSCIFIPYLDKIATNLGVKDHTYTNIHGEADKMHAEQLFTALSIAATTEENWQVQTQQAFKKTSHILQYIFYPTTKHLDNLSMAVRDNFIIIAPKKY